MFIRYILFAVLFTFIFTVLLPSSLTVSHCLSLSLIGESCMISHRLFASTRLEISFPVHCPLHCPLRCPVHCSLHLHCSLHCPSHCPLHRSLPLLTPLFTCPLYTSPSPRDCPRPSIPPPPSSFYHAKS